MARRSPQGGKGSRGPGRGRSPSPARPNWEAQAALDPCEPAAAKPASLPAARAMHFGRHGGRPLISVSCRSAPSPLSTSVRCQPRERSVRAGESSTPAGSSRRPAQRSATRPLPEAYKGLSAAPRSAVGGAGRAARLAAVRLATAAQPAGARPDWTFGRLTDERRARRSEPGSQRPCISVAAYAVRPTAWAGRHRTATGTED